MDALQKLLEAPKIENGTFGTLISAVLKVGVVSYSVCDAVCFSDVGCCFLCVSMYTKMCHVNKSGCFFSEEKVTAKV